MLESGESYPSVRKTSTGNAGNVPTQDGQGPNDGHASRHVDPLSEERGEDDRQRSSAKSSASSTAMLATTMWTVRRMVKTMRFNAPPFGRGASSRLLRLLSGAHSSAAGSADALRSHSSFSGLGPGLTASGRSPTPWQVSKGPSSTPPVGARKLLPPFRGTPGREPAETPRRVSTP
jgi:hypothetical protein